MNKKETKNTQDALSLTAGVLRDLFHRDSPKCIVNADDLALVDMGYMKNIVSSMFDKEQLTFVDTKKLAVLDLGALVVFFQYFGIFSAFFIINLGIVSSYLLNSGQLKPVDFQATRSMPAVYAKAPRVQAVKPTYIAYAKTKAVAVKPYATESKRSTAENTVEPSKALAALMAYQEQNKVLGASTVNTEAKETPSCSFKQGTKLYSNNSTVVINKADLADQVCIGLKNTFSTGFLWDVEGNNSKGSCVDLSSYNLKNGNINVSVKIENGENPSECSLLVKKIN